MKNFLFLVAFLFGLNVFASGKISIQPTYWEKNKEVTFSSGISIYEKIWDKKIYFNHWTGMGMVPEHDKNTAWVSSNTDLDFVFGENWDFVVSPGIQFSKSIDNAEIFKSYHVKLAYKLW